MSISQRIDLKTSQSLVMTPRLQQAIKLLQMSNQELTTFVDSEVEKNPLLDQPEQESLETAHLSPAAPASFTSGASQSNAPTSDESRETNDQISPDEGSYSQSEAFGASYYGGGFDEDEDNGIERMAAERPSLRAHLTEQIQADFVDPVDRMIAAALAELLDEAGYLPTELDLVRAQLGVKPWRLESVIARLQRLDPPGIFARTLQECLTIQLRDKNRCDPAMQTLLRNLDLVARRERMALMKICGVDSEDLNQMLTEIRALNPKPALSFASDVASPIVPDVLLRAQPGGGWLVELNGETLPRVLANNRYFAQVKETIITREDKDYLNDRWQQANWLVKALQQRADTILKVASEIVKQQDAFFVHGVQHLRPLVLRDIAAAVNMHESTISRVTQNKYIATPRGMFELKYFFTTALTRTQARLPTSLPPAPPRDSSPTASPLAHESAVSSEAVRSRIKCLIAEETAKEILSDEDIAVRLRLEGVNVARRTVAKYREAMKIPSSAQRRRDKREKEAKK
ncbi:MAG: RNA polymerase factor sigma-54 [Bdellovibrionales bacterium]